VSSPGIAAYCVAISAAIFLEDFSPMLQTV
jgi:hypothetical protein